ncbi:hypothetical protein [Pendulispora rubella]|uniref:hypothetical protein n=1 Tax=Pendulispora rubella TaxID=2741070 RepID=UPI0030E2F36A
MTAVPSSESLPHAATTPSPNDTASAPRTHARTRWRETVGTKDLSIDSFGGMTPDPFLEIRFTGGHSAKG